MVQQYAARCDMTSLIARRSFTLHSAAAWEHRFLRLCAGVIMCRS